MSNFAKKMGNLCRLLGLNFPMFGNAMRSVPFYLRDYFSLRKQIRQSAGEFEIRRFIPCLSDRFEEAGQGDGQYFLQDIFVVGKIFKNNPKIHVDIGSSVSGFVAHLAVFREIEVFDIRKLTTQIPNIHFKQADFMSEDIGLKDYCDSISSLHAIEHFGLGRYGDKVDYNGHLKGLNNIYRMLIKGGKFYFSVPIGRQRIDFNANRVFSVSYLLELFNKKYSLNSFSYIDDMGKFHTDLASVSYDIQVENGLGIFELTKL